MDTDKGETRISRIVENSVGDHSRHAGQTWCLPVFNPCASVSIRGKKFAASPAVDKPKGIDWSWPGRIMPAKSGWR
jgi:hypothetical protein